MKRSCDFLMLFGAMSSATSSSQDDLVRDLPRLTFFGNFSANHTHRRVCTHLKPKLQHLDIFDPASLRSVVPLPTPSPPTVPSDTPVISRSPTVCLPVAGTVVAADAPPMRYPSRSSRSPRFGQGPGFRTRLWCALRGLGFIQPAPHPLVGWRNDARHS